MILNVISIQKTKKNEAALMEWVNNCENLECALSDNYVVSIDNNFDSEKYYTENSRYRKQWIDVYYKSENMNLSLLLELCSKFDSCVSIVLISEWAGDLRSCGTLCLSPDGEEYFKAQQSGMTLYSSWPQYVKKVFPNWVNLDSI
ncbi:hypothetical protein XW75_004569 [Salmonella enterica subsp. enterica serovar Oranienburg]|uniref:hypothetical protein n=1 Tax=Salmonella enterica TaxID=28901 RepID=UPI001083A0E5|nr:hypothetical protein [Salmonella enterica]EBO3574338.1 hypothetical protein [Salmonella enterica subsp. enterica serovar Senftenberg]ECS5904796.1 hypothetical protein [Salmonella enterica subsp. enterica serovar Reading]EDS7035678.1 hypothetical protein [Salmonella enterica subsp. enterica serovar Oranienburg]EBH1864532.1 hypothetical protein [Salmonella enterica]EHE5922493.1 hypothetical protein [Salmonella enterica subsp. enterica serovar Hadar]